MSMSNGFYFAAPLLLLTACSTVNTRPEETDAFAIDASSVDAPVADVRSDAHRDPDASSDAFVTEPDAWLPDAFTPDAFIEETCDGRDEDGDSTVDEGAVCPGLCILGRCECPAGTDDCTDAPGCETRIRSREHCGACGVDCGIAGDCDVEGGPPRCMPTPVVDFTAASEDSGITCIARTDGVVICRGLNSDHAISEDAPEDAVLGWTDMGIRGSRVLAWGHVRADGVRTMTICVQGWGVTRPVYCRGSNATGLVLGPASDEFPGWRVVPVPPGHYLRSIEGGEGIAFTESRGGVIWGGPHAAGRVRSFPYSGSFGDGDRRFIAGYPLSLLSWGEPSAILLHGGWVDEGGDTLNMVSEEVPEFSTRSYSLRLGCYDNYCCAAFGRFDRKPPNDELLCWGGTEPNQPRERIPLPGVSPFRLPPRLFPTPAGVSVCVSSEDRMTYCMPLSGIHEGPEGRVLTLDPVAQLRGGETRADWRADCLRTVEGYFRCHGMHAGWP